MSTTTVVTVGTVWQTVIEATSVLTGPRFVNFANAGPGTFVLSDSTTIVSGDDTDLLIDNTSTMTGRSTSSSVVTIEDQGTEATFAPVGYDVRAYGSFGPAVAAATNTATIKAAIAAAYAAGGGDIWIPKGTGAAYSVARSTVGSASIGAVDLLPGVGLQSDGAQLLLTQNCPIITARSTLSTTATTAITADTTTTTTNLTVTSSANFAVTDDVFILLGDATYDVSTADWWLYAKVSAIPDGTHITIDRPLGYAATIAGITNYKSITRVDEWYENTTIDGLDLVNPMTGSANAEGGLVLRNARNVTIGTITGQDTGQLVAGIYSHNIDVGLLHMRRSTAQSGQVSKGKGVYLGLCHNWHFRTVMFEGIERDCINVEHRTSGVTIDNMLFDNWFAGRSTSNVPIFKIFSLTKFQVGTLVVIGNPTYVVDEAGTTGNQYTIGDFHDRTSGSVRCGLDCSHVRNALTLDDDSYDHVRTWAKKIPLTTNMSNVAVTVPAGYWRSCKAYASSVTGITHCYITGSLAARPDDFGYLSPAATVFLPNIGVMTQNHNKDSTTKQMFLYTDGTVPGGAYLTLEVEYFEDPASPMQTLIS